MVEPLIQVSNIRLKYGEQRVVDDVSFGLVSGRIMALIGPNGAGKSSIMRILAGLVKPEAGSVRSANPSIKNFHSLNRITGFFIEAPSFYSYLSATQNLKLLKKIKGGNETISDLLAMVGLKDAAHKKVGHFSKGMKQRLGIAQALINDPQLLVLDEPFHGLDPEVKLFLMGLIRKLSTERNKAILVSSHQLQDMEDLADDFILLNKGIVHLTGSLSDFHSQKQKVTFLFSEPLPDSTVRLINVGKRLKDNPAGLVASLSVSETAEIVKLCGDMGHYPYKVERENLLHSKYMEIAE